MSSVVISGDTSGAITVSAPAVAGTNTLTLQAATATSAVNTLGTAVASTSGTAIDFTGLPSWVKRITVNFAGVSTNGTSAYQLQLGTSSGIVSTGYDTAAVSISVTAANTTSGSTGAITTGFIYISPTAAGVNSGSTVFTLLSGNNWVGNGQITDASRFKTTAGQIALGGTLDRVRITTVNGTDTFDAGTINILYEG